MNGTKGNFVSRKLLGDVSSVTERGAKTCKTRHIKLCSRNEIGLKSLVSVSFNLQSPAIHQRLVEEPEILLKAENIGCSNRILERNEEYTSPTNCSKREMTTFAKSWNSCSDTGSSPMLVITWGTIQMGIQKMLKTMDIVIIF